MPEAKVKKKANNGGCRANLREAVSAFQRFLWYSINVILSGYANLGADAIAKME